MNVELLARTLHELTTHATRFTVAVRGDRRRVAEGGLVLLVPRS